MRGKRVKSENSSSLKGGAFAFADWARSRRELLPPRQPIRAAAARIVALAIDVPVIALGEAFHGDERVLQLRNELVRGLARGGKLDLIALESGLREGRLLNAYAAGEEVSLEEALDRGFSWSFGDYALNGELLAWLRPHNKDRRNQVGLYGYDMPGSPGHPQYADLLAESFKDALAIIGERDRKAMEAIAALLDPLWDNLRLSLVGSSPSRGWERVDRAGRERLSTAVREINSWFKLNRKLIPRWAEIASFGVSQVAAWLEAFPLGWSVPDDGATLITSGAKPFAIANARRDRFQADNLSWLLREAKKDGAAVVFGHRYHISRSPVRAAWTGRSCEPVMGSWLANKGVETLTVAQIAVAGMIRDGDARIAVDPPPSGALDAVLVQPDDQPFLLDLRDAPSEARRFLDVTRVLGRGSPAAAPDDLDCLSTVAGEAFDILVHLGPAQPATLRKSTAAQ